MNKFSVVIICFVLLFSGACSKDTGNLFDEFILDKEDLPNITVISENKAVVIDCSPEQFMEIRQKLKGGGFYEWNEFYGIAGVDDVTILDFVSCPLLYSFKLVKGKKVKYGIYSPVVVYDKQNGKLYLVMASDFGG